MPDTSTKLKFEITRDTQAQNAVTIYDSANTNTEGILQLVNEPVNAGVVIKKEDASSHALLNGAVFAIYQYEENAKDHKGTQIGTMTTGQDASWQDQAGEPHTRSAQPGEAFFAPLSQGRYVVEEITPPQGYERNTKIFEVTVGDTPDAVYVIDAESGSFSAEENASDSANALSDRRIPGSVTLEKEDADATDAA